MGRCERRPSASSTPSGSENTMPTSAVDERDEHAAPQQRVDDAAGRGSRAPRSSTKARTGKTRKNSAAPRPRRGAPGQSSQTISARADDLDDIDAPALGDGIGAVAEIVELLRDERPAGAVLMGAAQRAVGRRPDRLRRRPRDQRRQRQRPSATSASVIAPDERAREEIGARPGDRAAREQRRRQDRLGGART